MQAPIEETLQRIVSTDQPALLMSDFEEYNNGKIQTAAYAKRYFIEWLAKGYNITFYKWDYVEGNKPKHMFFAVFDDNANRLNSLVENAVKTVDPSIDTFVLGSRDFAYPLATNYYYIDKEGVVQGLSLKQGGNYHNSDGKDYVTFVMENGGEEDYKCYANTYASATGTQGQFAPLDIRLGSLAEYYPIGVKWTDAISEAKARETSTIEGDQFKHLIGNLYIDFSAQNGYEIMDIEVRTFDIQNIINYVNEEQEIDDGIEAPEINEILVAGMENVRIYPGWTHIFVNFDEKFNGSFPKGVPSCDMLRANIVISKASPNLYGADEFFGWPGNPSLSNSVREALTANTSNPAGRILFTYYIKSIAE